MITKEKPNAYLYEEPKKNNQKAPKAPTDDPNNNNNNHNNDNHKDPETSRPKVAMKKSNATQKKL